MIKTFIISVSLITLCFLSCSCGNEINFSGYPAYTGTVYPDEINTEETVISGNVFYCDPESGSLTNNGSAASPWPSLQEVIENNLEVTDHWHGISLYGAINCRIVNNTVVDLNDERPGPPWIAIVPHKDETPSHDCIIRNNIATSYIVSDGVLEDHNYEIVNFIDYSDIFADPYNNDFHLLPGTELIDTGIADSAPLADIEGKPRPNGNGYDPGAYEYY